MLVHRDELVQQVGEIEWGKVAFSLQLGCRLRMGDIGILLKTA